MSDKPQLTKLFRDDPATPEGKYLVKRRDGTVVEWPNFVLGARDPHAPPALFAYAESIAKDPDCHPAYSERLWQLAYDFAEYRKTHGSGDPTRGRHRKDDPWTIAEMRGERPAEQLFAEILVDLEAIACVGNGDRRGNSIGNQMAIALINKITARLADRPCGVNASS
jgi:hypothetical protein